MYTCLCNMYTYVYTIYIICTGIGCVIFESARTRLAIICACSACHATVERVRANGRAALLPPLELPTLVGVSVHILKKKKYSLWCRIQKTYSL